jgi:phage FluMu protein gp41
MKVGEKSLQNLRRYEAGENDWRTPEQRHAAAQKGAAASVEARRRKKRLQDAAKWLLMQDDVISNKDVQAKLKALGIEDATNAEALMLIALRKAASGNVEAMKFVRDTGGEAPKNQVELSGDLDRPVATMDLRNMSEEDLLRLAEARSPETGADED